MRTRASSGRQAARRWRPWPAACLALIAASAQAQDLGHKILGTLGLQAGSQAPTGLYVADQLLFYSSNDLFARGGTRIPIPFALRVVANEVGVSGSYEIRPIHTFVSASLALPIANVTGGVGDVRGSIDAFGLADAFIQPLALGWRLPRLDVQVGYAFYVPTGRFEPGGAGGVSSGSWSHELSFGGTVAFDRARSWQLSALASYELNQRKIGTDITRGSTLQLQGGLGKTLSRVVDLGVVGYGLWQVSDDSGADLPPILRGARDRVYGVGTELDLTLAEARARLAIRYTHELGSESRPQGQALVVALSFTPWRPRPARR